MSLNDLNPTLPPMLLQGKLIEDIAAIVSEAATPSSKTLLYRSRALTPYQQSSLSAVGLNGAEERLRPPHTLAVLIKRMREVMYRPGVGTWFTFTLSITPEGAVDAQFNYDDEPEWSRPTEPVFYVQDMERFPRDEAHTPAWLVKQLELGRIQDSEYDAKDGPRARLTPITEKH